MDEFNNRMNAQREILEMVNQRPHLAEELCGLSKKAIERWLNVNQMQHMEHVPTILFQISSKLFFLSSKSQEQVTEEYRILSSEIQELKWKLRNALCQNDVSPN